MQSLCDTPCYSVSMACGIDDDIEMRAGLEPSTDYRLMVEDAFGAKRISELVTTDGAGIVIIPLGFISDWIDLGAQLTITVLEDDKNEVITLTLPEGSTPDPAAPITCVLLIFDTDGNLIIN